MNLKHIRTICLIWLGLILPFALFGQHAEKNNGTLKGTITSKDGKRLESAFVAIKELKKTALSEIDGSYILKGIRPGSYQISFSRVGYQSVQQTVQLEEGKTTTIDLELNTGDARLGEVTISSAANKFRTSGSKDIAKLALANLENPQVYTTVNKELIQEQAVFSADDAIKNAPGISKLWSATGRAGDGGAYYSLRGFTVQAQLRDGMSGGINSTMDAANLERLEIIKGPSGTLYGSTLTSYGGLINRVTKKPYRDFGGEIAYSGGSYDFNRLSADINTPLDSARKALLRVNTAFNSMGSFQDNGHSRSFAFDPSFTYKINDRLTISLEAEINHITATMPTMYFFGTTVADLGVSRADQLSIDYKKSYQSDDLAQTIDNSNVYGQIEYKISDHWKSQTNISSTNGRSSGYQPYFYILGGNDSISRNVWTVDGSSSTMQFQQNFVGDFNIGSLRNRIVAGIDILNERANIRYIDPSNGSDLFDIVNTRGAIPNYNNFNQSAVSGLYESAEKSISYNRYNNYSYSAYVSDVLNITDNLLAMASLRIDHFTSLSIKDPVTATATQSFNQTTPSPKFGLVYQAIKDKVAFFGNYMNGFSNPGYNLSYDAATNTNVSKLFKSEQANQWEGGIKLDVFDGKLSSTISYYDIAVKNKVRPDAQHANASVQDGTQYSKGIEAEVSANPLPGLNIIAGFAHNDSKMEKSSDYDNGRRPQTAGSPNSGNLWISYTLAAGKVKGLGIGFGGNYASDNNILDNSYNGVFTLPSYVVINAGVFYNQRRYRLAINVNNLGNKEYWTGYTTVNPQMLRQIIASVAFKF